MNRVYRTLWSDARGTFVAVSENAASHGKRTASRRDPRIGGSRRLALSLLGLVACLLVNPLSFALPTGGQVGAGQGSIAQSGNTLTVQQSSQNLIVNWQGFSIGSGESVNFLQPGPGAVALNRVLGSNPSQIYGHLTANGQIFLVNPNGVLFGPSAQVTVGGLIASTLDISDADFLAGRRTFTGRGTPGSILNQGHLSAADGGFIALLGGQVSNQGTISARLGTVALAAGNQVTLDFAGDSLTRVQVDQAVLNALAQNGELIQADGGTVIMTARAAGTVLASVVNNSGVIEAQGVVNRNGRILLDGGTLSGSTTSNSGTLDVSNANGTGGSATLLGDRIEVGPNSVITASGQSGGGTILVGGNVHGAGPEYNASDTTVMQGARFAANAIDTGNGGTVVIWSDNNTRFGGSVSAQGGAHGGNGGFVETSGKNRLQVDGQASVDTRAARGSAGTWLLDPATITVGTTGTGTLAQAASTTDTTSTLTLGNATINAAASNVVLAASTSIAVNAPIAMTGSGVGITFEGAGGNPAAGPSSGTTLKAGVSTTNGDIAFDGNVTLAAATTVSAGSGNIAFNGMVDGKYALTVSSTGTNTFGSTVGANTPLTSLTVTGATGTTVLNGSVTTSGAQSYGGKLSVNALSTLATTGSNVTVTGAATLGANTTVNAGAGNVAFSNTVNDATAGADSLTVNNTGTTTFGSSVGASKALAGLTVNSGGTVLNGNLTVNGPIGFSSGVTLGNNVIVTEGSASSVTFGGAVDDSVAGAHALTLSASGATLSLGGAVGSTQALGSLTITAGNAASFTLPAVSAGTFSFTDTVAGGNVGQSGALNVTGAATLTSGANSITLNNAGNSLGTIRVVSGKDVAITDASGLTVSGISATGNVLVDTLSGNLTVTGNIATTAATASALTLEADSTLNRVATPGASDNGGNVLINSGRLSVGSGGIGTVYTGSIANSTGVAGAAGSGHSRYWSDTNGHTGYTTALAAGIDAIYREQPVLTLTPGAPGSGRTYNATTTTATLTTTGQVNGDSGSGTGTLGISGSGTTLRGAGTYTISVSNVSAGATLGGLGYAAQAGPDSNYTIVPKPLAVTGLTTPASKVYDGTTTAAASGSPTLLAAETAGAGSSTDGKPYTGDTVSVGGTATGTYNSKDVASATTVTFTGLSLSGAQAADYTLNPATASATITPASLTVTGTTVAGKVYDGTTAAALTGGTLAGVIGSDAVTLAQAGSFASKNAGTGIAVTAADSLSGSGAGNYTLTQPTGLAASITPKPITVSANAANKAYDGTTAATVALASSGVVAGDTLSFTDSSATFSDKNAGTGKTVSVMGIAASGTDATNYSLNNTSATTTASITPAQLSVTGTTAANKVYDGTTAATLTGGTLAGVIGSDAVTLAQAGSFATKNAGTGIAVTAADSLSGSGAGNYTLIQPTGLSASITPKPITVSAAAANKTYDGTTAATVALSSSGVVAGDTLSFTDTSATFSDANVGTGKTVTVLGIAASGADATNYSLNNTTATATASITSTSPISIITGTSTGGTGGTSTSDNTAAAYTSALPNFLATGVLGSIGGSAKTGIAMLTPPAPTFAGPAPTPATTPTPAPAASQSSPSSAPAATGSATPSPQQPAAGSEPSAPVTVTVVLTGSNGNALLSVVNNGIRLPDNQP